MSIRKPKLQADSLHPTEKDTLRNELLMELIEEVKGVKSALDDIANIFTPDEILFKDIIKEEKPVIEEPKAEKIIEIPKIEEPVIKPKPKRRGKKNVK